MSTITESTVPTRGSNVETRRYLKALVIEPGLSLNEVGAFIFERCNGESSVGDIVRAVTQEYDVAYDDCLPDVVHLLGQVLENGVLEMEDPVAAEGGS